MVQLSRALSSSWSTRTLRTACSQYMSLKPLRPTCTSQAYDVAKAPPFARLAGPFLDRGRECKGFAGMILRYHGREHFLQILSRRRQDWLSTYNVDLNQGALKNFVRYTQAGVTRRWLATSFGTLLVSLRECPCQPSSLHTGPLLLTARSALRR